MKMLTVLLLSCLLLNSSPSNSQTRNWVYNLEAPADVPAEDIAVYFRQDTNAEKLTLTIANPSGKKIQIILIAGGIRYYYPTSLKLYQKSFDFSGAQDGLYSFIIRDGRQQFKKEVRIDTHEEIKRTIKIME